MQWNKRTIHSYARPAGLGRTHIYRTAETRFVRTCIVITEKSVRRMYRLKIQTEEMTMITAVISFIAGSVFGITIMCVCIAAGRADKENNAE